LIHDFVSLSETMSNTPGAQADEDDGEAWLEVFRS